MTRSLSYLLDLFKINFRSAVSLRWAFIARSVFMAANNLIMFCVWILMFRNFDDIQGWTIHHMMILVGVGSGGFGLFVLFGNGLRTLANQIDNGELDSYLISPQPALLSAAGKSCDPSGLGELVTTLILCGFAWPVVQHHVPAVIGLLVLFGIFWASMALIFGSVAFWAKDMDEWANTMLMNCIIIGTNPTNIYSDFFKIIIFTVFPVGFVALFPIEYMINNQIELLLYATGGVFAIAALAIWLFNHGLKRYESGNRFGVRG